MSSAPRRFRLAFALAFAVTACGPLVQIGGNAPPPQSLLTLNASAVPVVSDGPAVPSATIGIDIPAVPATLQTLRLPVTTSATEVSYLVGATWAEQPARQFQRLVADTLVAAGQPVIDQRQSNIAPARTITGTLRDFGLDVSDAAAPVVRVRYDAQLSGPKGQVALRRFDAVEPVAAQTPTLVAAALNRAANKIAADVVAWTR